jgi:hypothetical protein
VRVAAHVATRAVFAIHLAIRCHILAVFAADLAAFATLAHVAIPANPLEIRDQRETCPDTPSKSGKNGNVDHPSQLCPRDYPRHSCRVAYKWYQILIRKNAQFPRWRLSATLAGYAL